MKARGYLLLHALHISAFTAIFFSVAAAQQDASSGCNARCSIIVGSVVGGLSFIALTVIVFMCLCYCCLEGRDNERQRDLRRGGLGNPFSSSPLPPPPPPPASRMAVEAGDEENFFPPAPPFESTLQRSVYGTSAGVSPPPRCERLLERPSESECEVSDDADDTLSCCVPPALPLMATLSLLQKQGGCQTAFARRAAKWSFGDLREVRRCRVCGRWPTHTAPLLPR